MSPSISYGKSYGSALAIKHEPILDEEGKATGEQRFQPRFRFTEFAVDRHSEVVVPMGMSLTNWKANPQVFFGHGMGAFFSGQIPTIGNGVPETIDQNDKAVDGDVFFDDDGTDEFATLVSSKVQKRLLRMSSIGFRSFKRSSLDDEPLIKGQKGIAHLKTELFELSIVPIPALTKARRLKHNEIRDEFNMFLGEAKEMGWDGIEEQVRYLALEEQLLEPDAAEFLGFSKKIIQGGGVPKKTVDTLNEVIEAFNKASDTFIALLDRASEMGVTIDEAEKALGTLTVTTLSTEERNGTLKNLKELINQANEGLKSLNN
ncbi:hypothetical protein LCGC14_0601940 [marine sediment metagenome]|uniref:Uncharacterized protein n=1 Tax=marine sediment metagenome TaxID=412755 RepID=A0A0F9RUC7_9ZZZZ